jgi:hypothetical protein
MYAAAPYHMLDNVAISQVRTTFILKALKNMNKKKMQQRRTK